MMKLLPCVGAFLQHLVGVFVQMLFAVFAFLRVRRGGNRGNARGRRTGPTTWAGRWTAGLGMKGPSAVLARRLVPFGLYQPCTDGSGDEPGNEKSRNDQ